MMQETKEMKTTALEDNMACTAYADADVECPIQRADPNTASKGGKTSLEKDLACVSYHEVGEDCPIKPHG